MQTKEPVRAVATGIGEAQSVPAYVETADVALAASGDARAFERLYRGHAARVHGLARRMLGPDEAGEATQDVFVRAWTKLGTFRGEAAFGTWLHRLAVNVLLQRREAAGIHRRRFESTADALEELAAPASVPGQRVDFDSAIDKLPAGARQVFVLHDVEGYKHEEIAQLLGITSGTSKSQLHRARMILRRCLA
ncbi:MAG: RNA polymerase sigma factor [Gemmatimonadota bacterium]